MKRTRWTPESPHQSIRLAIATASLLSMAAAPSLAYASGTPGDATPSASGVYVTILSPNPGTPLSGAKQIEISAYYESSYGVSSVDLFIDGRRMATQHLASPEARGEISFLVDPSVLHSGAHSIVVRATATDAEVASARTSLALPGSGESAPAAGVPTTDGQPQPESATSGNAISDQQGQTTGPSISVVTPAPESTVEGIVRIKVNATDPSGKSPYVSLFVDHAFKTLRNYAPYTFDWDTTRLPNGVHTIEVWGYNDAQQVGHTPAIRVMVNNPGGRTFERHDLLDSLSDTPAAAPTSHAAKSKVTHVAAAKTPAAAPVKTAALRMKPLAGSKRGLPMIAHAVKNSVASMLAKADRLASISSDSAPLGAGSVDETLTAPIMAEHAVPHLVPNYFVRSRAGAPLIASNPLSMNLGIGDAHYLRMASSDLSDLESADLSTAAIAPQIKDLEVPHLVSIKEREVPHLVPLAARRIKAAKHAAPAPLMANSPASIASAKSGAGQLQMVSATVSSDDNLPTEAQIVTPNIDIHKIAARAAEALPAINRHEVTLSSLNSHQRSRLNGTYQVVVDNQRVEMDRPLQARGSILFAPLRQIFESEGGQLGWDNSKQQVHGISPSRSVLLTIGSKQAVVNNKTVNMSAAPYLLNNRTMLPLSALPIAMDVRVTYDAATGHLVLEDR